MILLLTMLNFAKLLLGLCLDIFETGFILIRAGVLPEVVLAFHPLFFINKVIKDLCSGIMGLCSRYVTEHSSFFPT